MIQFDINLTNIFEMGWNHQLDDSTWYPNSDGMLRNDGNSLFSIRGTARKCHSGFRFPKSSVWKNRWRTVHSRKTVSTINQNLISQSLESWIGSSSSFNIFFLYVFFLLTQLFSQQSFTRSNKWRLQNQRLQKRKTLRRTATMWRLACHGNSWLVSHLFGRMKSRICYFVFYGIRAATRIWCAL